MGRPKGSGKKEVPAMPTPPVVPPPVTPQKQDATETAKVPLATDKPVEKPAAPEIKKQESVANIATQDAWKYHPDLEPRIFRKGEEIPAGWTGPEGPAVKMWRPDDYGKWHKVPQKK